MLVLGNGESRKNLTNINPDIGCNAAYRDFTLNHLVCVDRRMVNEALSNGYQGTIYTREMWINQFKNHPNVTTVPNLPYKDLNRWDDPFHWGSGPYAVLISTKFSDDISLLGFDLYSKTKCVNNVYKDTPNYDPSTRNAINPIYWLRQISKIFKLYPNKYFTVYNETEWIMPSEWSLDNVSFKTIDKLYLNQ